MVKNEKFVVNDSGVADKFGDSNFQLVLPRGKHFEMSAVKNGEDELKTQDMLKFAMHRNKSEAYHITPFANINDRFVDLPRTLQQIMSKHPYPLSQGPVQLPIDCLAMENYMQHPIPKSISEVLSIKTVFSHEENQGCFEWSPVSEGVSAWGRGKPSHEVRDLTFSIHGAASTMDMGVVYTCEMAKCVIRCPCNICKDPRNTCKHQCRSEVCRDCRSQCTQHELSLSRLFDFQTDHFTMVTQKMTKYQFAVPHAGIPLDCDQCSKDVLEHQVLHMVWHVRCRFCRLEMRPFEQKPVVSITSYKLAEKVLKNLDGRTCSACLIISKDSHARRKHEETVHEGRVDGKFKCYMCNKSYSSRSTRRYHCCKCYKSYSNRNALEYHQQKHENIKYTCSVCGFQSSSEGNLVKHSEVKHDDKSLTSEFKCKKKF